ncbi:hypothetical protein ACWD4T_00580 [Streptomyces umbrinus]
MAAGEVIADFLEQELVSLRQRATSLEARGVTVITTSGVLVTLLTAFVALMVPEKVLDSSSARVVFVALALCGFLAAATFGILANLPRKREEVDPEGLRPHLGERYWSADKAFGQQLIADARIKLCTQAQETVDRKGKYVFIAFGAELLGMLMLSVSVVLAITNGSGVVCKQPPTASASHHRSPSPSSATAAGPTGMPPSPSSVTTDSPRSSATCTGSGLRAHTIVVARTAVGAPDRSAS